MSNQYIGFNRPYKTGHESGHIAKVLESNHLSGNGSYTKKCQDLITDKLGCLQTLLTPSCTAALEMCALLIDIQKGDEVILPSYTFVSTANAFILQGAKLVFVDSSDLNPNIDIDQIEPLISARTKAIVVVHYGGISVDMNKLMSLANKYNIKIIEDAAQAFGSFYNDKPLGTFGDLGTLSFHETKNVHCGEGGALLINKQDYSIRAEIIRDKGTNRASFFRGEVNKYQWVDVGSSYLLSEMNAAFLYPQCETVEIITRRRLAIWHSYYEGLIELEKQGYIDLTKIPDSVRGNGHLFYLLTHSLEDRTALIEFLKSKGINAVFHYISLHNSPFFSEKHDGRDLPMSDKYTNQLLRLPVWIGMEDHIPYIVDSIYEYYKK